MSSSDLIVVKKLTKVYDNRKVVDGINFNVKRGEVFGILGPNGAGKTTTLEMMETIKKIDGGEVFIDGLNVAEDPQEVKYIIGVQPQTPSFINKLKLTELLEQMASTYGIRVNALEMLKNVNLSDKANSYIDQLSGGQKQRFSLVAALINNPKVLFMDEPTTGLDPQARQSLWEFIREIRKSDLTVVLTTHYMEEAESLCDRVAIMDSGKIVKIDTPKNLIAQLLKTGFKKDKHVVQANLEDVFINLTGNNLKI